MSQSSTFGSLRQMLQGELSLHGHDWPTRLRLWTGLTMFAFVASHLTFHAMGLVSIDFMEQGMLRFLGFWTGPVGETVLSVALLTHVTLVLTKVVQRTTLRLPTVEWLRLILGVLTLLLLCVHVASNIWIYRVLELSEGYTGYLLELWPWTWPLQLVLLLSAWTHGCIGVHMWLRLRPGYRRFQMAWLAVAILLPAAALAGLLSGSAQVRLHALDTKWLADQVGEFQAHSDLRAHLMHQNLRLVAGLVLLLAAVFGLRALLRWRSARNGVRLSYPGREVIVPRGTTVLDASRMHGIPHASVCGGRGRCSTCRIRIVTGIERVSPVGEDERKVLARIRAPDNVRLACQVHCTAEMEVVPLVPPNVGPDAARPQGRFVFGSEMDIAIMFTDIRGFTRMSEKALPYDTVHILNQYFEEMSEAIVHHHGHLDKFIGDGIMALFGLQLGATAGCRHALGAAREMSERLERLNARLQHTLPEPLKIGIGIHAGTAIVGEMGHRTSTSLTALGDSVNTASRVEGLTKSTKSQLVVTARVAELARVDLSPFPRFKAEVKGKTEFLHVYAIPSALELPEWLSQPEEKPRRGPLPTQPAV